MEFTGTTALVTGGTSGIGRATAAALAATGASVIITRRNEIRGLDVVTEIGTAGKPARFIAADLRSHADGRQLVKDAGPVDIRINSAGYWDLGPTTDASESGFNRIGPTPALLRPVGGPCVHGRLSRGWASADDHVADNRKAHG
jgi:NAD(P)-dependent dehydrogenase (short-subunit alcohol dehydrogenase family)